MGHIQRSLIALAKRASRSSGICKARNKADISLKTEGKAMSSKTVEKPRSQNERQIDRRKSQLLVLDGETNIASRVSRLFEKTNTEVVTVPIGEASKEKILTESYDLIVATSPALKRAGLHKSKGFARKLAVQPRPHLAVLGSRHHQDIADFALNSDGCCYAELPITDVDLETLLADALGRNERGFDQSDTGDHREAATAADDLLGRSASMREVYRQIELVARTEAPVLLVGETGTGKDVVARILHRRSERGAGPYIPVNLSALPQDLVPSELFGHEKGAFTGATERRQGKFELAQDGVLFLDEIDSMSKKVQVSLLRLLEENQFYRLGAHEATPTNARLVAASNRDLRVLVKEGSFRKDLFYRLDVFTIPLPPLRDRPGDIGLLSNHFLKRSCSEFNKNILSFSPECAGVLESYSWPGNVRELQNVIQRAVLVCTEEVILPEHLPGRFQANRSAPKQVTFDISTPLLQVERRMIEGALAATRNNRKRAAEILGISRRSLYTKLEKHGMR
jgi:DNA-binding NtrC family response regulator